MNEPVQVLCGDARAVLAGMEDASVDAVVTDPPAGIAFMGTQWDNPWEYGLNGHGYSDGAQRVPAPAITSARNPMCRTCHKHKRGWKDTPGCSCMVPDFDDLDRTRRARHTFIATLCAVFEECRRVLKPGGYALVWALPRTSHWTATALEDAGFEIRDSIQHLFGSGFPKSKSCLKPAHEVWWLAKAPGPLQPLQIDACRIPAAGNWYDAPGDRGHADRRARQSGYALTAGSMAQGGRWPPNALFSHHPDCQPAGVRRVRSKNPNPLRFAGTDGGWASRAYGNQTATSLTDAQGYETVDAWSCHPQCPIRVLDEQAGPCTSGAKALHHVRTTTKGKNTIGSGKGNGILHARPEEYPASTGSASRFFPTFDGAPETEDAVPFRYVRKASRSERNGGLDGLPERVSHDDVRMKGHGTLPRQTPSQHRPQANHHPCVKPLALMQWLCRLVTPPAGLVLDPFAGSGSTGVSCVREGFSFIGIEQDAAYVDIARARIAYEQEQHAGPLFGAVARG